MILLLQLGFSRKLCFLEILKRILGESFRTLMKMRWLHSGDNNNILLLLLWHFKPSVISILTLTQTTRALGISLQFSTRVNQQQQHPTYVSCNHDNWKLEGEGEEDKSRNLQSSISLASQVDI